MYSATISDEIMNFILLSVDSLLGVMPYVHFIGLNENIIK